MSGPSQKMEFNAFDYGPLLPNDKGTVEYWNYEWPEPLHYTAHVLCATVSGEDARFTFQIPDGWPGRSGLHVVAAVHEGGSPGTNEDAYGHAATLIPTEATAWCENGVGVTSYPTVGGILVVHNT